MERKIVSALLAASLVACSCDEQVISVQNRSFSISAGVEHVESDDSHRLRLELCSGDRSVPYTMEYFIDGTQEMSLRTMDGETVNQNGTLSFSQNSVLTFLLPETGYGSHVLKVCVSSEHFSAEQTCPFVVTDSPFACHAEVSTESSVCSSVLVSLTKGLSDRSYTAEVIMDGKTIASLGEISFAATPIAAITLPLLRPGTYALTLRLTDGKTVQSIPLVLKEPLRYPTINGSLSYDSKTGRVSLSVDDNPYGMSVSSDIYMTVDGSCTVNLQTGYFHGGPKTQVCTLSMDESTVTDAFVPVKGRGTVLCDFTDLERRLTARTEDSYVWAQGYDPEKEEEGEWCLNFTEKKNYEVVSRRLDMRLVVEKIDGLKLVLSPEASWMHTTISYE